MTLHHSRSVVPTLRTLATTLAVLVTSFFLAPLASAQVSFSIEYRGTTVSLPDTAGGVPITEADILTPALGKPRLGPVPQPSVLVGGGAGGLGLALHAGCVGHPVGVACKVEVDAFSYGMDGPAEMVMTKGSYVFSIDEFSRGAPGTVPSLIRGEGALAAREACADAFIDCGLPPPPLMPFAVPPAHTALFDGNGWRSDKGLVLPGIGLMEWNPPGPMPILGDDLDALDVDGPVLNRYFFSLDAQFADPLRGWPSNAGSAAAHGFAGGDVLLSVPPAGPVVYASANQLGLDLVGGPDSDDIDALAIFENEVPGYQRSLEAFDWIGGSKDMLLFSVRRASAVIGMPDSLFGIPIEEGDILMPPVQGGLSPYPAIFIAAENFGLLTMRSGGPTCDDLDALDVKTKALFDCNMNGMEDAIDIAVGLVPDCNKNGVPDSCDVLASGVSADMNGNGMPDECEYSATRTYCVAQVNSLVCTPLIGVFGTPSATSAKPYWISAVNVISRKHTLLVYGYQPAARPFMGGTLCIDPPIRRTPVSLTGGPWPPNTCNGVSRYDFNARIQSGIDAMLHAGVTAYAQFWSRDKSSAFGVNLSDAIQFTIAP